VRLLFKDRADDADDRIVARHPIPTAQLVHQRPVTVKADAPLALVRIGSALGRIASDRDEVGAAVPAQEDWGWYTEASGETGLGEVRTEPLSDVLPETAVVDEMRPDLREVEPVRLEEEVVAHVDSRF